MLSLNRPMWSTLAVFGRPMISLNLRRRFGWFALAMTLVPSGARAQVAQSFDELQRILKAEEVVVVIDEVGQESLGRVAPATPLVSVANWRITPPADSPPITAFAAPMQGPQGGSSGGPAGERKWEIEVHGGGTQASNPTGGTASLPGAGASFTTYVGLPSRRASSWYVGDGALLLNQLNTAFFLTQKFTPLDPVLAKSGAERQGGGNVGFRVNRQITPRFSAEFSLDYVRGPLKMTDAMLAGIEASRASFTTNFNTLLLSTGGPFTNVAVTSTSTLQDSIGRQIFTTGAVNIKLIERGRIIPYVTVGAGAVTNRGDLPSVSLVGNYQFRLGGFGAGTGGGPGPAPVNETDTVKLHYVADNAFVTVLGGGVKRDFSARWGLRADVRAYFSKNTVSVLLDANPVVATGTPAGFLASFTNPSLQVSNNLSTGVQSTLSGPAISGFKTFTGSGTQTQVSITVGFFTRF